MPTPWEIAYTLPANATNPNYSLFGGPSFNQDVGSTGGGGAFGFYIPPSPGAITIPTDPLLPQAVIERFWIDIIDVDATIVLIAFDATGCTTFAGASAISAATMFVSMSGQQIASVPLASMQWGQILDASNNLTYGVYRFLGTAQPNYPLPFYTARPLAGQLQFLITQPVPFTSSSPGTGWKATTAMNVRLLDQGNLTGQDGSLLGGPTRITMYGRFLIAGEA
jgi:hypothetical protein